MRATAWACTPAWAATRPAPKTTTMATARPSARATRSAVATTARPTWAALGVSRKRCCGNKQPHKKRH